MSIGGTIRGAEALMQRFGSRSWASYIEPAIQAAEEGAIVTSFMYGFNFALFDFGFLGDLRQHTEARKFYMPDGHLVGVGRPWKMPALAETLRKLAAEGPDYMYTGAWGQKFVEAAQKSGGRISMADMEEYAAIWDKPVQFSYRGHTIYGSPPPDTGGLIVGYNLNILENFDLKAAGHYAESIETLETISRAFGRVHKEVSGTIRDPLNYHIPSELWLSKEYGKMGAEFVRNSMPKVSAEVKTSNVENAFDPREIAELGSDHIVIADKFGNWISMLHTIHGGAPGVFIDGVRATGSGASAATNGDGRRLILPITAIMIADENGKPWLAMGTPGNPPQPVTEVLINILDFGMKPLDAADAPRFWAFREGEKIEIESRLSESVRKGIGARGMKFSDLGPYNYHTGSMQIVYRDKKDGKLHGVTDARRLGSTKGH